MKRRLPRRPLVFSFEAPDGARLVSRFPVRAYLFLLWHGVWPVPAVKALGLMRRGTIDAADDVWLHVEPYGVSVNFATSARALR